VDIRSAAGVAATSAGTRWRAGGSWAAPAQPGRRHAGASATSARDSAGVGTGERVVSGVVVIVVVAGRIIAPISVKSFSFFGDPRVFLS
jgi:hypothetical protein